MKAFLSKQDNIQRIEFWAATTLFVFIVFFHITHAMQTAPTTTALNESVPFDAIFVSHLARYTVVYCSFLLLNFTIAPRLLRKEGLVLNTLFILVLLLIAGFVFGVTDTYLKADLLYRFDTDGEAYTYIFQKSYLYAAWLLLVFGFYTVIKYTGLYVLAHAESIRLRYPYITYGTLATLQIWLVGLLFLVASNANRDIIAAWNVLVLASLFVYTCSFYFLIPSALKKAKPYRNYAWKIVLLLAALYLPTFLVALLAAHNADSAAAISLFNAAFQLFLIVPLSWIVYNRVQKGNEQIDVLKKELGQTHASFDFLRSQINPHFLFNALNTIYGTALQEKAERTSEGIEKLGDMMRFMLQENMQDKIALLREIDYLNNYISLQKLRTDPNPAIRIESLIEQPVQTVQIAPMLLIPFVENAFKHGISFREPSHIRISLELRDRTLYFDVYNSKHNRVENDPEKGRSGIGLQNVRQRLQLLYPKRHELVIRETGKDYFVHLTIQLL